MPHGAVSWIELPAADPDASATFFETVFGWIVHREGMPGYIIFQDPAGHVGGGFRADLRPTGDGPLVYLSVDDIDAVLPTIEAAGGRVLAERTAIDEQVGWWASFRDPGGNVLGLYQEA